MAKEFFGRQHARCEYQDDKVGSIGILGCNRRRGSNTGSDRRPLFVAPPPRTKKQRVRSGHDGGPAPLCLHVWPRLLPAAQSRMPFHGECDDGFWRECLSFGLVRLVSGLGIFFGVCPLAGLLHESRRHDPSFRSPTCPKNIPCSRGARFIACDAQGPLKAVALASPEDGGKGHGVFTWALLEGLRGAAVN